MSLVEFEFPGWEEVDARLLQLSNEVVEDPDNSDKWEALALCAYNLEGGLHRNSSPHAIAALREVYDKMMNKFPLFFGYWVKYAENEFTIARSEAAELVYEKGVAAVRASLDLWIAYLNFKMITCQDYDLIRELFERATEAIGLDWGSNTFWDLYLGFEERSENWDKVLAILDRIIRTPLQQYAKYFERFRAVSEVRPVAEICAPAELAQYRAEIVMAAGNNPKSEQEIDISLRVRVLEDYENVHAAIGQEVAMRWTFETSIERAYFVTSARTESEQDNWRQYLEFEEGRGDHKRIVNLFERALIPLALYEEFWMRYLRYMQRVRPDHPEDTRIIYLRACYQFVAIAQPKIRLHYALFEEANHKVELAHALYEAILMNMPGHVETILAWAKSALRHGGVNAAIAVCNGQIETADNELKSILIAEVARLLWKKKNSPEEARQFFEANIQSNAESRAFWAGYIEFELGQPAPPMPPYVSEKAEDQAKERAEWESENRVVTRLVQDIKERSGLQAEPMKSLVHKCMECLLAEGGPSAAKQYLALDAEVNSGTMVLHENQGVNGGREVAMTDATQ